MARIKLYSKITNLPSEKYHAIKGTYSSSQLKDLVVDPDIFYQKYIAKTIPRLHIAAFDVGTYTHSGVLEPHNLENDCAVFPGSVRRGERWERFKLKHPGKSILTQKQADQAEGLIRITKESEVAMGFVNSGEPEVSMFVKINVIDGWLWNLKRNCYLTESGWVESSQKPTSRGCEFIIKVRADMLGDGWIYDLKTTSGNARNKQMMQEKVDYYKYDLSAALYLDIFTVGLDKVFDKFIWTFTSKDCLNSRTYMASDRNIINGRRKVIQAFQTLALRTQQNWEDIDFLDTL